MENVLCRHSRNPYLSAVTPPQVAQPFAAESDKPNIVVIVGDDVGFADTQPYGSEAKPQLDGVG
ncbi:hypothetical protein O9992_23685 [Vibrio lentus]|nr:hypothetical protein [Vibrio lentus]